MAVCLCGVVAVSREMRLYVEVVSHLCMLEILGNCYESRHFSVHFILIKKHDCSVTMEKSACCEFPAWH